ncbi:MAG: tRNA uridine-5-carboxymethylaminomethyl(34) synthesis GTPase MnmE [Candidatus Zixiibacteriota bacterium]|nr:MAG: tRNA uridine-5-carboxymethylaminomethyl(34) synthesis GTPase MnmE [candidate division Zixibacteria bacterium]
MKRKSQGDPSRDTIAAIITPPGEGGLGAIRISGPGAHSVIERIFRPAESDVSAGRMFHLYYGHIVDVNSGVIDEVTMAEMPEGKSYTGQKQAEIFCHGGRFVLQRILEEIFRFNVRPAEPGEFTRRAFLAGRIDLARAEAVAELVASKTEYSYSAARKNLLGLLSERIEKLRTRAVELIAEIEASIDFPDEALETAERNRLVAMIDDMIADAGELVGSYKAGRIIKEGYRIAITGRPNAGKSSLFNVLLNQNRALVTPTPGTTRDYLTEWIDLDGVAVSITDTAGLRSGAGPIEKAGMASALKILKESDRVVWIADISRKSWRKELTADLDEYGSGHSILMILNKIDKLKDLDKKKGGKTSFSRRGGTAVPISCKTKAGMGALRRALVGRIRDSMPDLTDGIVVTSGRHKRKLENFLRSLKRVRKGIERAISPELAAFEMRQGINEIDEITGRIYNEEILDRIFSRFCVGK